MPRQSFGIARGFRESPEGDLDSGFTNYNSIQLQVYKTLFLALLRQFKSRIFLDVCGFLWMFVDSQGCLWISLDSQGCLWMPMDSQGFLWISMSKVAQNPFQISLLNLLVPPKSLLY